MLGLSLAIRVGKRVLGGLIDSLMSAIKGRATYSENIADSKQVVKDIDNYELLDKASILLTPTAYSDARVHSVKTYTGDELVNSNNWINNTSGTATITDGVITFVNGTGYLTQGIISANTTYKFSVTLSNVSQGQLMLTTEGGVNSKIVSTNGINDFYLKSTSSGALFIFAQSSFTGSIDNVSVTEADADFDFDRASSATRINSSGLVQDMQSITDVDLVQNGDFEELGSDIVTNGTFDTDSDWTKSSQSTISNGTARILSTDGSFQFLKQSGYTSTQGETVKITIDIVDVQSGQLKVFFDGGANTQNIPSTVGTHTVYLVNDGTVGTLAITRISGVTDITIDNVSVQQVDPNDRWTLGTGWSIADGELVHTGAGTYAEQGSLTTGNEYEVVIVVTEASGSGFPQIYMGGLTTAMTSPDTYTFYITAQSGDTIKLRGLNDCKIASVSVKDITFSTDVDLARINYDSNGENGHWLLEPTSTNLVGLSEFINPSQVGWAEVATNTYTNNYSTAPDGNQTSTRVQFVNPNSSSQLFYLFNSTSGEYSASIYAKGSGTLKFGFYDNASVLTDTITLTSEWQRFEITKTLQTTSNARFWIYPEGVSAATDIEIWGAQLEELSYATSYIPTYGSTVTRATETLTGSGNSTLINSTEGVLYAEFRTLSQLGTFRQINLYQDISNRIYISKRAENDNLEFRMDNPSGNLSFSFPTNTTNDFVKVAFRYGTNNFAVFIDGVNKNVTSTGTYIYC